MVRGMPVLKLRRRTRSGDVRRLGLLVGPVRRTHRWRRTMSWVERDADVARVVAFLGRALATSPRPGSAAALQPLLTRRRPRFVCFVAIEAVDRRRPRRGVTGLLTPDLNAEYAQWRRAALVDAEATGIARRWSAGCPSRVKDSTDVTLGVDYFLVRSLLEDYYRAFDEVPA